MRHYQQLQFDRRHLIDERRAEVYAAVPELRRIDDRIAEISMEAAARRIYAVEDTVLAGDVPPLKEQIRLLSEQKQSLIAAAGFPGDYLEPSYVCSDCKDMGFIDGTPCHCYTQAALDITYRQSNLKRVLADENFDNFTLKYYSDDITNDKGLSSRENARIVLKTCQDYVKTFSSSRGNLLLYGNTGTGKTFLTHCIAGEILKQGYSVIYLSALDFFEIFEDRTFNKTSDTSGYENIFSCDLLIIDDLGTELANSFTNSNLFQCINQRLLLGKATIISTNLSVKQLRDQYSERVSSRIYSSYTFIKLFGNDIRIARKMYNLTNEGANS